MPGCAMPVTVAGPGMFAGARNAVQCTWESETPVVYQRVRDQLRDVEVPLETYQRFQQPRALDAGLMRRVLLGLSCRRYAECAEAVPEAFGLAPSTVSRRYIRASARQLRALNERRLDGYDLVAVLLDGKAFAEDEMVIVLGVTVQGHKVLLGFVQTATENGRVCAELLRDLVARGLRYEQGLLVVIDGSKGLRRGVQEVFGDAAAVHGAPGTSARMW